MSEINKTDLPSTKEKKEMTNASKIILGAVLGLLTVAGITLSGAINEGEIFRLLDQNLKTVLQYLWVGFFLVYIFWFRSIENNKGFSMKQGRYTYLIVIAVYLIVVLVINLAGGKIAFFN